MTAGNFITRGKRTYKQTHVTHCMLSVTDRVYSRLQNVMWQFEFRNMDQVVDFLTRDIKQERVWARPEGGE